MCSEVTRLCNDHIAQVRRNTQQETTATQSSVVEGPRKRGQVTYDDYSAGMVCTCSEHVYYDEDGDPMHAEYAQTVTADRATGTETGSYWYSCSRCGAGAWSGC